MALERSLESFCWSMNAEYLLFFIVRTIYSWIFVLCSAFLYEVLAFGVRFTGFCLPFIMISAPAEAVVSFCER